MSLEACYLKRAAENIHTASKNGDRVFVQKVIKEFPYKIEDYFTLDKSFKTPLTVAIEYRQTAVIKLFMQLFRHESYGKAYETQLKSGYSPFHEACKKGDKKKVVQFLKVLNSPHKLFARDKSGDTPLHTAVKASQIAVATLIVEEAKNWCAGGILIKNNTGETVLDIACRMGHVDFFKSTVEAIKASRDAKEKLSDLAKKYVKFAKKYGLTVFDKKLLPKKNVTSELHLACERGDDEIISTYFKSEISPFRDYSFLEDSLFVKDEEGRTPLHLACLRGHKHPVASYMVQYEKKPAKLFMKDRYGQTPFLLGWGHKDIRELFFRIIGKDNMHLLLIPDNMGKSLLHLACEYGFEEIVEEYMSVKGVYKPSLLDIKDLQGDTPLTLALRNEHQGVVNIYLRVFTDEELFPLVGKEATNFLQILLLNGNKETAKSFINYRKAIQELSLCQI